MKTLAVLIGFVLLSAALCFAPVAAHPRLPDSSFAFEAAASTESPPMPAVQAAERKVTAYTLPPDLYKKAHRLGAIYFRLHLLGFAYGLAVLWALLDWRLSEKYRDWAERFSARTFQQAVVFTVSTILTIAILDLPLRTYGHYISVAYGISVEGWGSWFWDWTKQQILDTSVAVLLIWLLYAVIRRSPRRWWFYFWLATLPIIVILVFLQPLVVDPLFYKFEPLQSKDPALTASLEQLVERAGEGIPPDRIFWMRASEKTKALNAYVTGVGKSKRIVVWDTTIAKMNRPQVVTVAGHEMGHYVLNHVWKGLAFAAAVFFILFYLGFRCVGWMLGRWGAKWGIRGVKDWASLPALLLLLSIFGFIANPITNGFNRHIEHQADQYALEVTHGLIPDAGQVAAQAEQILGEVDLSDPDPNPVDVFLFYTHPPTAERIRFELSYDPWAKDGHGEFVP